MGTKSYLEDFSVGVVFRTFLAVLLFLAISVSACRTAPSDSQTQMTAPDVLVLVAYGNEKQQVAISYNSDISVKLAQKDLNHLMRRSWTVESPNATIESVDGTNSKPTTSVIFYTTNAIDVDNGIINLEPLVEALKRFKQIEIICIGVPNMEYMGSTSFEDKYVKLTGVVGTNSYRYQIRVKNDNFKTLDFPKKTKKTNNNTKGDGSVNGLPRLILIIGVALLCAVAAYFAALLVAKRNTNAGGQN